MSDRIVTLFRAENAIEAHVVRSRLAAEGIEAFVAGEMSVTSLAIVGTALGGVKVHVRELDYERACAVLSAIQDQNEPADEGFGPRDAAEPDWKCPECGERVPGDFDLCWGCGAEADRAQRTSDGEVEAVEPSVMEAGPGRGDAIPPDRESVFPFRDPELAADDPAAEDATDWICAECGFRASESREICPACGAAADGPVNPYRSTGVLDFPPEPLLRRPAASDELEAVVGRAFRASIFGTIFCPPLLCPYASLLLLYIALKDVELSPSANRKFYMALACNLLVGIPLTALFLIFALRG